MGNKQRFRKAMEIGDDVEAEKAAAAMLQGVWRTKGM